VPTNAGGWQVMRANMDGVVTAETLVTGLNEPTGLALDVIGEKMYWVDGKNVSYGKVRKMMMLNIVIIIVLIITMLPSSLSSSSSSSS
jgi:predicted Rossmann-fold nucleotide-binding protein